MVFPFSLQPLHRGVNANAFRHSAIQSAYSLSSRIFYMSGLHVTYGSVFYCVIHLDSKKGIYMSFKLHDVQNR
jgi:hypothetical protein